MMTKAIIWQASTGVDIPDHQWLQRNITAAAVAEAAVSDRLWAQVLWRQDWLQCSRGANEAAIQARFMKSRARPFLMKSTPTNLPVDMRAVDGVRRSLSLVH
jgi:hypothetical protein